MLSKCSFILNKGPVNMIVMLQCNLYVRAVNIFPNFWHWNCDQILYKINEHTYHCISRARGVVSLMFKQALQNIHSKFVYCWNHTSYENFKLQLSTCAQNFALGICTKFQLEILTINVISCTVYFHEIILENSWKNPLINMLPAEES